MASNAILKTLFKHLVGNDEFVDEFEAKSADHCEKLNDGEKKIDEHDPDRVSLPEKMAELGIPKNRKLIKATEWGFEMFAKGRMQKLTEKTGWADPEGLAKWDREYHETHKMGGTQVPPTGPAEVDDAGIMVLDICIPRLNFYNNNSGDINSPPDACGAMLDKDFILNALRKRQSEKVELRKSNPVSAMF